jgi:hypothetical protein
MALSKFKASPIPRPPAQYDQRIFQELVRVIQLYFSQLDSPTANYASSYLADKYYLNSAETGPFWTSGSGSPETVVTAPVGSIYSRLDGGATTTLYIKTSGTGNTGWVAK